MNRQRVEDALFGVRSRASELLIVLCSDSSRLPNERIVSAVVSLLSLSLQHFCAGEFPFPEPIGLHFTLLSREEARALGNDDGDDGLVKLLCSQGLLSWNLGSQAVD